MEIEEAIFTRRTVRKYSGKPVEKEKLLKIIDAARHSPTACNYQNWHFVVVDEKETLNKLHFVGAFHAIISPVVIFTFYSDQKGMVNLEYQDHIQSASAAVMSMVYMAQSLGLGTDWVCDLPSESNIKAILGVPKGYRLVNMLNIGYPDQKAPQPKKMKPLEEIYSFNKFARVQTTFTGMYQPGFKPEGLLQVKSWGRRLLVWLWLRTGSDFWKRLILRFSKAARQAKAVQEGKAKAAQK